MKKLIANIIFVTCIFSSITLGYANSGPVSWKGSPASEVMVIDENSPIIVNGENLVFDFSEEVDASYTIGGRVTASYEMFNPTNESQLVQMAFPFVGTLEKLSPEDIIITTDGNELSYEIYIGDVVDNHGYHKEEEKKVSFDFENIVSTITNNSYSPKNFREKEIGRLYTIDVNPTTDQRINFSVDFGYDHEKTKVLTYGFSRLEHIDNKIRIATWCYGPETLEIFVIGEDVEFNINAYIDGELQKKTDLFTYEIYIKEREVRQYLMEYVNKNTNKDRKGIISDTQLYNLYAKTLDKHFMQNMVYSSRHYLLAQEYFERIFTLVYTVEFPPKMSKEVSISYITSGTMDRSKTVNPLYTFDYILNPAKNWKDFKNLNIEIIPGKDAPYVIDSNIELAKDENGIYTAALVDLPEEDLTFTLYANEEITLYDRVEGAMKNIFGPLTPIVMGGAILIAVITIIKKLLKRKNFYAKNRDD